MTNCMMAWNLMKLQRVMERVTDLPAAQMIAVLREIGPVGYRYNNCRGPYRFPVERYAGRLLAAA